MKKFIDIVIYFSFGVFIGYDFYSMNILHPFHLNIGAYVSYFSVILFILIIPNVMPQLLSKIKFTR